MKRPFTWAAVVFIGLVCVLHLARLAMGVTVIAGGQEIPFWMSAPAAVVTGVLSFFVAREAQRG